MREETFLPRVPNNFTKILGEQIGDGGRNVYA